MDDGNGQEGHERRGASREDPDWEQLGRGNRAFFAVIQGTVERFERHPVLGFLIFWICAAGSGWLVAGSAFDMHASGDRLRDRIVAEVIVALVVIGAAVLYVSRRDE